MNTVNIIVSGMRLVHTNITCRVASKAAPKLSSSVISAASYCRETGLSFQWGSSPQTALNRCNPISVITRGPSLLATEIK
jgi:hypothetical protein